MKPDDASRPSDNEAIEATAAAWLAERDDGLTPAREAEFARWRDAHPHHAAAVTRLESAWTALQQLRDFRPEAQRHPDRDLLRASGMRSRRARLVSFPAIATAALAAAFVLVAAWWFDGRRSEKSRVEFATTVDGYERVALEDGSLLELNSNSAIRVNFTPGERRVHLVHGEVHFTVAKNRARPFFVEAGGIAVRAVGTAFNVRLGAGDVEVLVTEGKVEVGQERTARGSRGNEAGAGNVRTSLVTPAATPVEAGHKVVIFTSAATAPLIEKVGPEAVREALAWQGPRLVFVDTPLADAIAQFNRRNPVQLELADAELGALPIGGSFRAENVDAFVRLLESGGDIASARPDTSRVVLRKAK
jgi:transmembrane sensor